MKTIILISSISLLGFGNMNGNSKVCSDCSGNACKDIDYQYNESTGTYFFFNDGDRNVKLKVTSATVFGCGPFKNRKMRAGDRWDSGFHGICDHVANYE